MALILDFAQAVHEPGQGNIDRTHRRALVATGGRVRQVEGVLDAGVERGQHRPHRAGIDPAVGMAAEREIDRAMVHAGATADAAQHVGKIRAGQCGTPVVDQDEEGLLGAFRLTRAARSGQQRNVVGNPLPGGRARQQAHQRREVVERRDDLLDAGDDDMHPGQRRHHAAVALVGHQRRRTAFGDQEVGPGNAHFGRQEMLA